MKDVEWYQRDRRFNRAWRLGYPGAHLAALAERWARMKKVSASTRKEAEVAFAPFYALVKKRGWNSWDVQRTVREDFLSERARCISDDCSRRGNPNYHVTFEKGEVVWGYCVERDKDKREARERKIIEQETLAKNSRATQRKRNDEAVIYRMFGRCNELLYIGISSQPCYRFNQHVLNKTWIREVARVEFESKTLPRAKAEHAEQLAIKREKPKHNIAYNWPRDEGED